jgi:hypothetical protein
MTMMRPTADLPCLTRQLAATVPKSSWLDTDIDLSRFRGSGRFVLKPRPNVEPRAVVLQETTTATGLKAGWTYPAQGNRGKTVRASARKSAQAAASVAPLGRATCSSAISMAAWLDRLGNGMCGP